MPSESEMERAVEAYVGSLSARDAAAVSPFSNSLAVMVTVTFTARSKEIRVGDTAAAGCERGLRVTGCRRVFAVCTRLTTRKLTL